MESDLESEEVKLLFFVGVVFLLWVKYFWDNLQESEDEESYPDGLNKCPPETYPLDDSENVKCISCPQCAEGMEPTPPCGTIFAVKLTGECVPCRKGTFSQGTDSAACKPCTDCGSRETVSSCTTERDAECKECPWLHYEDQNTRSCKHCDSCCGQNSSAHLECIKSRTCRANCSHAAKIRRKFTHSILRRWVAKANNIPSTRSQETTSVLISKRQQKNRYERSVPEEGIIAKNEAPLLSELFEGDENVQVGNPRGEKDNPVSFGDPDLEEPEIDDRELLNFPDFGIPSQEQTDNLRHEQPEQPKRSHGTSAEYTPGHNNANDAHKEGRSTPRTVEPIMPIPTAPERQMGWNNPPTQVTYRMLPVSTPAFEQQRATLINISSLLSSFMGTFAALVLFGLILFITYKVYRLCTHKESGEYERLDSTNIPGQEGFADDDLADESRNKDEEESLSSDLETTCEVTDAAKVVEDLNLCDIPPDLEDILVVGLDVTHGKGQSRMCGWQKVGNATGIPRRELKFYQETAYKVPNGSPTKMLLEKLGTQGKTISDLLHVLQKPRLQLGSIAASVRHRVTGI